MKKIFIAGHKGMVGSAIYRQLLKQSDVVVSMRSREELDLCNQKEVLDFMKSEKPDEVILAAAKVGGIHANNTYPADFIYQNLQIQNNVINASFRYKVKKLLFLDIDSTSVTFISLTIAKMIPGNPAPLPISNREPRSISLDKI